jgi:hypothetical protein
MRKVVLQVGQLDVQDDPLDRLSRVFQDIVAARFVTINAVRDDAIGLPAVVPKCVPRTIEPSALVECWPRRADRIDQLYRKVSDALGAAGVPVLGGYLADEVVQIDYARYWLDGEPTPGPKTIWFVRRAAGLTRRAFGERWTRSAVAAKRTDIGLWRYTQSVTLEAYGGADPTVDGIAISHSRSVDSFPRQGRTKSDEAKAVLAAITESVANHEPHFTEELILRSDWDVSASTLGLRSS